MTLKRRMFLSTLLSVGLAVLTGCGNDTTSPPAPPHIELAPVTLSFEAVQNWPVPIAQPFTITNTSEGTLNWSVTVDSTWLSVSPTQADYNEAVIQVSITTTDREPGTYQATVTISSTNADNSPQTVAVTYTVSAQPLP